MSGGDSNPFHAAFENDGADSDALLNPSPYQLGSIYGEDTMSLLDNEFSHQENDVEQGVGIGPPPVPASRSRNRDAPVTHERERTKTKQNGHWCCNLILCYSECREYSRTLSQLNGSQGSSLVRQGMYLHWISMVAYLLNFIVFSTLWAGKPATSGVNRNELASFMSWIWAAVYLVVGSYFSWYGWVKPMFQNINSDTGEQTLWFKISFFLFFFLSVYLFAGIPGTGSAGLIAVLEIRNWVPGFQATTVLCAIFTTLQGITVCWSL
eukprot:CAMPEP_0203745346 /NCGR_PEP_ID=MMETSP0098-20131031/1110_1 /ASSEMBLY_ACC=CAM_ASM_000208 /TAXON_ID=96639 /ORGANISM=" , Strain NY0313808BC1" /LENGTH=265 /DNA_ID=CAMNT_0050633093 /DNA_START=159 /DNA_END=952 /DNA_ORIENTATION=-